MHTKFPSRRVDVSEYKHSAPRLLESTYLLCRETDRSWDARRELFRDGYCRRRIPRAQPLRLRLAPPPGWHARIYAGRARRQVKTNAI